MPAERFYVLFQQGWRVDQLMRLMVDHIEYRPKNKSDVVHTIRNVASETNLKDYLTFLKNQRACLSFAAARAFNFFSRPKISTGAYFRADSDGQRRAAGEGRGGCVVEESGVAAGSKQ